MGMRLSNKVRRNRRRIDQPKTKATNLALKTSERARRDARMVEKVRAGNLPYPPAIMSWLSRKLDMKIEEGGYDDSFSWN